MENAALVEALYRVLRDNPTWRPEYQADYDSPCRTTEPDEDNLVEWQPVRIDDPVSLAPLEELIGEPLHPDARTFLTTFYHWDVVGKHSGFHLSLGSAWNREEFESEYGVIRGVVSHLEVQRDERLPFTIPIAGTDAEVFFAIRNATGEIVLQDEGRPDKVVAPDLRTFLEQVWQPPAAGESRFRR